MELSDVLFEWAWLKVIFYVEVHRSNVLRTKELRLTYKVL